MLVRITRKFAEVIDGVSLSGLRVGDVINLPPRKARLLIAEQWAIETERRKAQARKRRVERRHSPVPSPDDVRSDRDPR